MARLGLQYTRTSKGLLFSLVGLLLILSLNIKAIFTVMKTTEAVMKVRPENSGLYGM